MEPVYIPRDPHEKAMQRALIQYRKPENYKLVKEALRKAGREDLVGYGAKCLIRPVPPKPGAGGGKKPTGSGKPSKGKPRNSSRGTTPKAGQRGATPLCGKPAVKGKPFGAPKFGGAPNKAANAHARNRAAQGRQGANRH